MRKHNRDGAGPSDAPPAPKRTREVASPFNWTDLEEIHDSTGTQPLIPGFSCRLASGNNTPIYPKKIAESFARMLASEMRYDNITYTADSLNTHDIYFIFTPDFKKCVGVFIFQRDEYPQPFSSFFNSMAENYTAHIQNKTFPLIKGERRDATEAEYFGRKVNNNLRKLDDAQAALPLMANGNFDMINFFNQRSHPSITKYDEKTNRYQQLRFYSRARGHLQGNIEHPPMLTTAFIVRDYRRRGLLSKLLPIFQYRYGVFNIDGPSNSMKSFIKKNDVNHLALTTPNRMMESYLIS